MTTQPLVPGHRPGWIVVPAGFQFYMPLSRPRPAIFYKAMVCVSEGRATQTAGSSPFNLALTCTKPPPEMEDAPPTSQLPPPPPPPPSLPAQPPVPKKPAPPPGERPATPLPPPHPRQGGAGPTTSRARGAEGREDVRQWLRWTALQREKVPKAIQKQPVKPATDSS